MPQERVKQKEREKQEEESSEYESNRSHILYRLRDVNQCSHCSSCLFTWNSYLETGVTLGPRLSPPLYQHDGYSSNTEALASDNVCLVYAALKRVPVEELETSEMMEDKTRVCQLMAESEVDIQIRPTIPQPQSNNNRTNWSNGQCVFAVSSCSALNPSFDLSLCRAKLESDGFQIPVTDMEAPLRTALEVPSVRRYMVFNSAFFHFMMAPVLYVVMWCAAFSTLHFYITVSDYWVLCLSVSLVSIFLTTAIIFILHLSNKEINMNLDVRLIQVNERMVKHKLLVAVADWVQNCTGNMQLYFVYWDIGRCLRALTEALEEGSFVANDTQKTLERKMSHLILVSEVTAVDPEVGGAEGEQDSEEQRPLLGQENTGCSSSSSQQGSTKVTATYSLIPNASLPAQEKAYQLLMTYSAAYVKLLVSKRLSGPSHHSLRSRRNHCNVAPLCLCQYIKKKILR